MSIPLLNSANWRPETIKNIVSSTVWFLLTIESVSILLIMGVFEQVFKLGAGTLRFTHSSFIHNFWKKYYAQHVNKNDFYWFEYMSSFIVIAQRPTCLGVRVEPIMSDDRMFGMCWHCHCRILTFQCMDSLCVSFAGRIDVVIGSSSRLRFVPKAYEGRLQAYACIWPIDHNNICKRFVFFDLCTNEVWWFGTGHGNERVGCRTSTTHFSSISWH